MNIYKTIGIITSGFAKQAQLKSTTFENQIKLSGKDLPIVYHAGKQIINKINSKRLGKRDEGWYGAGFYVSFDKDYVKRWYGPKVTSFEVKPNATAILASIDANQGTDELWNEVVANELRLLKLRKEESRLEEIKNQLKENQIEWVHAVDRLAEEERYDLVIFNDYEIVVKNPKILSPVDS